MAAPFTRVDFIAQQLKAAAPNAEWNMAGHDRALELARIFERNGIVNLARLFLVTATVTQTWNAFEPPYIYQGFALQYDGRKYGFLGTPNRADATPILELDTQLGYKIAWSAVGHGNVSYIVKRGDAGGIQIVPVWASSSDAAEIRGFILTTASLALSFAMPLAGIQAGAALGSAIVGPTFAAAYPAATAALGNIAISTVMNGGDVGAAISGAAMSFAAGVVGQFVGGAAQAASGSAALGRIASAATSALVRGGDLQDAALSAAVQFSAGQLTTAAAVAENFEMADEWWNTVPDSPPVNTPAEWDSDWWNIPGGPNPMDPYDEGYWNSPGSGPPANTPAEWDLDWWNIPGGAYPPGWPVQTPNVNTGANPQPSPALPAPAPTPAAPPAAAPAVPPPSAFNPVQLIQQISGAAMAALSLVRAYRDALNPRPVTTARTVSANGAVTAASSNGMVQTRNPNGSISSSLPAVGVPQATIDGNLIVNNGDGTYTLIYADGRTEVRRYGPGAGSDPFASVPGGLPVVGIAAAGVLFLLMSRKR